MIFTKQTAACRAQHRNLVTDIQGMLGLWREHFNGLLNADTNTDGVEPEISIADDGIDIAPADYNEICKGEI